MTSGLANAQEPSRWKTILVDVIGFAAVIWSIPLAILLIGTPIVLVVGVVLMTIGWIFA